MLLLPWQFCIKIRMYISHRLTGHLITLNIPGYSRVLYNICGFCELQFRPQIYFLLFALRILADATKHDISIETSLLTIHSRNADCFI